MNSQISIEGIPNIPFVEASQDVGEIILAAIESAGIELRDNDIICIASKVISIAEERVVKLTDIVASDTAQQIHQKVPRKDARIIQFIINQTGKDDASRVVVQDNYIAGGLPNGLRLTSAGVDKMDSETVILLPENSDQSAKLIGQKILESTGVNIGIIITDSDGREDKKGATQIAIGVYGIPPLRITESLMDDGKKSMTEETLCDMLAASAALIMGQRGTNKPAVLIRGVDYIFNPNVGIKDSLNDLK